MAEIGMQFGRAYDRFVCIIGSHQHATKVVRSVTTELRTWSLVNINYNFTIQHFRTHGHRSKSKKPNAQYVYCFIFYFCCIDR